jgi:hypothetical protein
MNILRTLGIFFSLNITWHDVYAIHSELGGNIKRKWRYLMINKSFLILSQLRVVWWGEIVYVWKSFWFYRGAGSSPHILRHNFLARSFSKKMIYGIFTILISMVLKRRVQLSELLTKKFSHFHNLLILSRNFLSAIYLPLYHSSPC